MRSCLLLVTALAGLLGTRGQQTYGNLSALALRMDPTCAPEQINMLLSCYSHLLATYGLVVEQTNGYRSVLPRFARFSYRLMATPLYEICQSWNVLMSCTSPFSLVCINRAAFSEITYGSIEARDYVQNHAFFEYACGRGNPAYMANEECLSRALSTSPLSRRLADCGAIDPDIRDTRLYCVNALTTLQCVKGGMMRECGIEAGITLCHTGAQIVRRIGEVDGICTQQLDETCSAYKSSILLAVMAMFITLFCL